MLWKIQFHFGNAKTFWTWFRRWNSVVKRYFGSSPKTFWHSQMAIVIILADCQKTMWSFQGKGIFVCSWQKWYLHRKLPPYFFKVQQYLDLCNQVSPENVACIFWHLTMYKPPLVCTFYVVNLAFFWPPTQTLYANVKCYLVYNIWKKYTPWDYCYLYKCPKKYCIAQVCTA